MQVLSMLLTYYPGVVPDQGHSICTWLGYGQQDLSRVCQHCCVSNLRWIWGSGTRADETRLAPRAVAIGIARAQPKGVCASRPQVCENKLPVTPWEDFNADGIHFDLKFVNCLFVRVRLVPDEVERGLCAEARDCAPSARCGWLRRLRCSRSDRGL
eukprot:6196325-Pleurochrysis_carterae.AAC.1